MVYYNLEQYGKCIPLEAKAVELTEKIYGADTNDMAKALNNLSMVYSKLNRYAEALPLMERAYELRRKLLGEDDPSTVKLRERVEQFREKVGAAGQNPADPKQKSSRWHWPWEAWRKRK